MGNKAIGEGSGGNKPVFTPQDISKLYKRFNKLDVDGSGQLELSELTTLPELALNPLVKRVVSVLDINKDGNISFMELITGLGTLSGSTNDIDKLKFAFKVYDVDEDNYISNGDLFTVLKMMVGTNLNDVQLQQLVDRTIIRADKDFDGMLSFEEFCYTVKELGVGSKLTLTME